MIGEKGLAIRSGLMRTVNRKFCQIQMIVPVLTAELTKTPQNVRQYHIYALNLAVRIWIMTRCKTQLSAQSLLNSFPKMRGEPDVPVANQYLWHAMQTHYLMNEMLCRISCRIRLLTGLKMNHTRQLTNEYKHGVEPTG